ncbi:MAG: hypothetical protein COU07_01365 [Candidatus Harrisonbacteria bacterium CG10_big_fil_rev_8_21_14_0_10_40_38]|uniref:Cell division protein FtsL n=1 Tax=Candidatus Harrisonbacteria bacterium CG10_big_fil_rev_8_21_14_0_10_40_38 TaxID=1974583 RepID=A0A2H0UT20_9BACT|nr:MAG: hypothetical protein COU07_01365 [Candidatus Harrisonbacteria bacterium CG10_big_fil_rev_8_21_14_0_10_40_38]
MTIIEPNKKQSKTKFARFTAGAAFALVFTGSVLSISLYNNTVDLRHRVSSAESTLQMLREENDELKGQVFSLSSVERVRAFGEESGFIQQKSPKYLEVDSKKFAQNL